MALKAIDVFLSHSSKDKKFVKRVANSLVKSGIKPWLDEVELRKFGGLNLINQIKESIQKGKKPCMLLFISSHSSRSKWVDREINWIIQNKRSNFRIIPILLEQYKELELSENMRKLLEDNQGEKTTYYFEASNSNFERLINYIIQSVYNHYNMNEEKEIVIHAGHRLALGRLQIPKIWEKHKILDFRTNLDDKDSYYVPTLKEILEMEKGLERTRKALINLQIINFCGATFLNFTGLLSKIWGRGSSIDLKGWNNIDSQILEASFDILTEEPTKYIFEIDRIEGKKEIEKMKILTIFIGWQESIVSEFIKNFQKESDLIWMKTQDLWKDNLKAFISQIIYFITQIASNYEEINIVFGLPLELVAVICWNLRAIKKINLYEYKRRGRNKYIKIVQLQ